MKFIEAYGHLPSLCRFSEQLFSVMINEAIIVQNFKVSHVAIKRISVENKRTFEPWLNPRPFQLALGIGRKIWIFGKDWMPSRVLN